MNSAALSTAKPIASLSKTTIKMKINNVNVHTLIDCGSSDNFIHPKVAAKLNLPIQPCNSNATMASSQLTSRISGKVLVNFQINEHLYENIHLYVMENLCMDVILGLKFQCLHESVTLKLGGTKPPLVICGLSTLNIDPPRLFSNVNQCKPVAARSRRYSNKDKQFIKQETARMLREGIIEPSNSPWRAQVVVVKDKKKERLAIDYSETINKFTELDAYPLPLISEYINNLAQYKVFSKIDLKSAYHQIPINEHDKPYTAFESDGKLFQFKRMPFGVTNGVSCFQRIMDDFVEEEKLADTFPFMDDITIGGRTQEEHDVNLKNFLEAAERKNLTYNKDKCVFSVTKLCTLGYIIEKGEIRPDPERLQALHTMPVPSDAKAMKRVVGMFAYYSKWIVNFSDKIAPLINNQNYPVNEECCRHFEQLKIDIENSVVTAIDENLPFELETDASDIAIAAVLNQNGRPVAFFSRTLNQAERKHAAVEKEACAIIESIRHWRHYLTGKHFKLITDQKGVSFIFNKKHSNKIKNDKISRWKIELSCYDYDIVYREGKLNIPADTFSRVYCSMLHSDSLVRLHNSLCHPGVTRLYAFVKSKNLPFSVEDVRQVTKSCQICSECKPRFHKPPAAHLIKSTQPFERLNIDFKGPIPSSTRNQYILTIIDEYSRFPFAFACQDVTSETVKKCLIQLFSIFGLPSYIHSDRGSAFMSRDLKNFLHEKGVAPSRTTPYNPQCNGQTERYNGIIMKTIQLALRQKKLDMRQWERVLPDALHSIRSLISTATASTPHERLFVHQRKSAAGCSVPSWLNNPGPVLLKRHVRNSKYEPLVDEVHLIEANPQYAHIRFPNGKESTVSVRHLAPTSEGLIQPVALSPEPFQHSEPGQISEPIQHSESTQPLESTQSHQTPQIDTQAEKVQVAPNPLPKETTPMRPSQPQAMSEVQSDVQQLRRSTRTRKQPSRYDAGGV